MKTRSFIGLIFLAIALFVAATPGVLESSAHWIEVGAKKAGVPEPTAPRDPDHLDPPTDGKNFDEDAEDVKAAEAALILKGYDVGDPDLRDRFREDERELNDRGRLETGQERLLLPGQADDASLYAPPPLSPEAVLLDIDGCPVFAPSDDVAQIMAVEANATLYEEKVNAADDPEACATRFDDRVASATETEIDPLDTNTVREAQRDVARADRSGALALQNLLAYVDAIESVYGPTLYGDAVFAAAAELASEEAAAAGTGTAA